MKVGFVGCGKLGLMVALTIESKGHEVRGYDVRHEPYDYVLSRSIPFQEEHSDELLKNTAMQMVSLPELCEWADILFLAPQTPHGKEYEGITPLPGTREDFDYSYLQECVASVDSLLPDDGKICVIISTVLPGTMERLILPTISRKFRLVYSPQFIAMGTVYEDFLNPEFWLIGAEDKGDSRLVAAFFGTISDAPLVETDIRTAEGIKVFYNTFITTKTVLANLYGEAAHKCGMNVDDIFKAISLSTRRLLSPRYLEAGMGDGGGCHPRDNIALSHLARRESFSFDFFESLMIARQKHCEFLADVIQEHMVQRSASRETKLSVVILGKAFKPETNIETGSPSMLLSNILTARGIKHWITDDLPTSELYPSLYFIGTKHERYKDYKFQMGSVVIDPFRYLPKMAGVKIIQIGKPTSQSVNSVESTDYYKTLCQSH